MITADRNVEEANRTHQELNRIYEMSKEKIDMIKLNGATESKQLVADVKDVQNLLRSMQNKIASLKKLSQIISSRQEKQKIDVNVQSHEKQLNQLQINLRDCSGSIRKEINEEERKMLLRTRSGETATGNSQRRIGNREERSTRLRDCLAVMSNTIDQSETTMGSLVHSSTVLSQTHSEFENQAGHIQTGSKLMSKYEQRELTEKILLFMAVSMYFGVVYYILQKRVLIRFWFF